MTASTIFPHDRVTIVGVLNVTPDSFSDGGRFVRDDTPLDLEATLSCARELARAGADWIDVGGESTRPGSRPVPEDVEIARTRPVIEALRKELDVSISIDTRKAAVADAALAAGAAAVNDVSGFAHDPEIAAVTARHDAGAILGHLRGEPGSMQQGIHFDDVVGEVALELGVRARVALEAGVARERLAVDPGIGFGKELAHNLALLAQVDRLREAVGLPILVGPSRKAFLGRLTGDPAEERDTATHAACAVAIFAGANAIRVHDVSGARRVVQVAGALRAARAEPPA